MSGYTKLFSSIVTSTIWRESDHVRLVWVTMLALSDRHGMVEASVPGLADMARVSRSLCEDALRVLSEPDQDSRTKDLDGRRIVKVDGGWQLVNHARYREKMSEEERRARNAAYMKEYRSRKATVGECKSDVITCNDMLTNVSRVEHAEAAPDPDAKADQISDSSEPVPPDSEPAIVTFPCSGMKAKEWHLTRSMVEAWSDAWPGVDVVLEAKRALAWVNAKPERKKSYRGMPAFLTSWCSRTQDRGGTRNVAPGAIGSVLGASPQPSRYAPLPIRKIPA